MNWIKTEHTLPDKPEVIRMASLLKIDQDAVTGKLLRVWIWADQNSVSGENIPITAAFLDRMVGKRGFASAMCAVGWLEESGESFTFSNFIRHNGSTAKARAESNRRMSKSRSNRNIIDEDVAQLPQQKAQPEKIREDKRREDKNKDEESTPPDCSESKPLCTIEQAIAQAPIVRMTEDQARVWWHTRNSSGWTKGSTGGGAPRKITSWQSDMSTSVSWAAEAASKAKKQSTGGRFAGIPEDIDIP